MGTLGDFFRFWEPKPTKNLFKNDVQDEMRLGIDFDGF